MTEDKKLIIANCSGFFGDRFSAAKEMVEGGPIDFLTGDYLAELTMAILFRKRLKDPKGGFVSTFLRQMEEVMGTCMDKGIKVVANAGGLNPAGLAERLNEVAENLGVHPKIAYVEGDDLMTRLEELSGVGENFTHLDKGIGLKEAGANPITANAYLGGWGITKALSEGADIVVTGRVADASIISGPCAWKFGWKEDDWDRLAGAYVAGHVIECGAQATGGNYSFFEEVPSFKDVGYPIAEMFEDGSFIITKHPNTGGLVSVDTVKAQLLYEIGGPGYLTPDVIARFDTIDISEEGKDRVKVKGVMGEPPTDTTKVCMNVLGGHKNSMTIIITGLDIEKKAKIFEDTFFDSMGGKDQFQKVHVELVRSDKEDPTTNEEAFAQLRITVIDPDSNKAGRLFSSKIVELALASIPGFTLTSPPTNGTPTIFHWPALVSKEHIVQRVVVNGNEFQIESIKAAAGDTPLPKSLEVKLPEAPKGKMVKIPLGRVYATRSGDKGGNANLGIWAKTPEAFSYLREFLTTKKLKELLPDMAGYEIDRYEFMNLLALNFYIHGVLGEGAAASVRMDPLAKSLGEYLRAKTIDIPESIVTTK